MYKPWVFLVRNPADQLPDPNSALVHRDFSGYHPRLITPKFSRKFWAERIKAKLRIFTKRKQQCRLTAAFYLTALTVLTKLTALTADRIDHVDIVDGQAPMRPSPNEVNLVNNVRCQCRQ